MTGKSLSGKVAVITGASSGIGAASARLFAEAGARVHLRGAGLADARHGDRLSAGTISRARADLRVRPG